MIPLRGAPMLGSGMTVQSGITAPSVTGWGHRALRWSGALLVAAVWASAFLFGVYIVSFYAGSLRVGAPDRWNEVLPRLYEPATPLATTGIAVHFVTGGVLLLLGPIQLLRRVREAAPRVHRWIGWTYVSCSVLAGLGGLGFIASKGTVGGAPMSVGFSLYGILIVLAAIETARHARARRQPGRLELHRAWAIRLFALAIGSWLYRMEYGFWFLVADGAGHTREFGGWFDWVMDFFFYLPNLAVAELFIRARRLRSGPALRIGGTVVLVAAAAFVLLATWNFAVNFWLPGILEGVAPKV